MQNWIFRTFYSWAFFDLSLPSQVTVNSSVKLHTSQLISTYTQTCESSVKPVRQSQGSKLMWHWCLALLSKTTKLILLDSLLQEVCISSGVDGSLTLSSLGLSVCLCQSQITFFRAKESSLYSIALRCVRDDPLKKSKLLMYQVSDVYKFLHAIHLVCSFRWPTEGIHSNA